MLWETGWCRRQWSWKYTSYSTAFHNVHTQLLSSIIYPFLSITIFTINMLTTIHTTQPFSTILNHSQLPSNCSQLLSTILNYSQPFSITLNHSQPSQLLSTTLNLLTITSIFSLIMFTTHKHPLAKPSQLISRTTGPPRLKPDPYTHKPHLTTSHMSS